MWRLRVTEASAFCLDTECPGLRKGAVISVRAQEDRWPVPSIPASVSPHSLGLEGRYPAGRCPRKSLYLGNFTTCWPVGFLAGSLQSENRGLLPGQSGPPSGDGVAWSVDMDFVLNMPSPGSGAGAGLCPCMSDSGRQTLQLEEGHPLLSRRARVHQTLRSGDRAGGGLKVWVL